MKSKKKYVKRYVFLYLALLAVFLAAKKRHIQGNNLFLQEHNQIMKLEKLEEMELIDQFAFLEARSQNFVFPIYFHQQKVLF